MYNDAIHLKFIFKILVKLPFFTLIHVQFPLPIPELCQSHCKTSNYHSDKLTNIPKKFGFKN